jgi:tetratricopeptide (TPR) repeat protein
MLSEPDRTLEDSLWISLLCCCDVCNAYLELPELEHLLENEINTLRWAEEVARIVRPLGWTSPETPSLLCPRCSAQENDRMENRLFQQCYAVLLYDSLEHYEFAIQSLTDHLRTNSSNAAAHHNRAVAYWEIGEAERALEDFAQAKTLAPANQMTANIRRNVLRKFCDLHPPLD